MPRQNEPTERTCIVTRTVAPTDRLIRFVAAPDGAVVADLRHRLPGRGVWVTADAEHVRTAEKRKLFARAFESPVTVEPGLAGRVADRLADAALESLSLARKAGALVTGFAKVESAIAGGRVVALVHASDAGTDGAEKLGRMARARSGGDFPVIRQFTGDQLDLALGRANVIHAALLAGPASSNVLARVRAFADFVGGDHRATGIHDPRLNRSNVPADL